MGEFVTTSIEGLVLYKKKQFQNEAGAVFHFLKKSDDHFQEISEVYFSFTNHGVIKGWKYHKEMEQNFVVPVGNMKFVFFDDRENSATKGNIFETVIGVENYYLIKVPARLWYSFSPTNNASAMITNATSVVHHPEETLTKEITDSSIPYKW